MNGSLRERGAASWEMRVDAGTNPDTRKRRYRTATVTGNRGDAERALARLVAALNFYAQAVPGGDAHAAATLEALLAGSGRAPTAAAAGTDEPRVSRHRCCRSPPMTLGEHPPVLCAVSRARYCRLPSGFSATHIRRQICRGAKPSLRSQCSV